MFTMAKTIIILGAGWAGLPLAHKLLKYTAPKTDLKVVLVTPNTHFFWNVAATRGIIAGAIPDEKLFLPIKDAFEQYSSDQFELLLGSAESIIPQDNTVAVLRNSGSMEHLRYDHLVIATGSRITSGLPLKPLGTHASTLSAWHDLQQQIQAAKSIIIAGAGPTGVEVAGELAAKYGSTKTITLVMSQSKPLSGQGSTLACVRRSIDADLQRLGVQIVREARVTDARNIGSKGKSRQMTVRLSNGKELTADCYLPLHGIQLNTSFVPAELLDEQGNVSQEPTMKVKGTRNIWAIGDVGSLEAKQLTVTDAQIIHLASNLDAVLTGSEIATPYKPTDKTMLFVSLGTKFATGQIGNWKLFGFMVSWVKGRRLFVDTAEGYVGGKYLRHAAM
jgi:NADH dehydrogenase FAD-containing subunit